MNYELVLATHNNHKVKEIREILSPYGITLYGLNDLNLDPGEVKEDGKTYYENALIKAREVMKLTNLPIIADDSGLEIDALDGFPGLNSARYASKMGGHHLAMESILEQLKDEDNRKARFCCTIVLVNQEDEPLVFEGEMKGHIAPFIKGNNGFGYDPFFIADGYDVSIAELPENIKNKLSHRYKALRKLITYLKINSLIK